METHTPTRTPVEPESIRNAARKLSQRRSVNVGVTERAVMGAAAFALFASGVRRRGLGGSILGSLGAVAGLRAATGYCPAYHALGITDADASSASTPLNRTIYARVSTTIARSPAQVYQALRNVENARQFIEHIDAIEPIDEHRSRWVYRNRNGRALSWIVRQVHDDPERLISWRSEEDHGFVYDATVEMKPAHHGTEVTLSTRTQLPGGALAAASMKLAHRDPQAQAAEIVRRFKALLETGEAPTSQQGQPRGTCGA